MDFSNATIANIITWLETREALTSVEQASLSADKRAGVRGALEHWVKRRQKEVKELQRLKKLLQYERNFWEQGILHVAGIDEAGRGPLAGPVVVAAVVLPVDYYLPGINDSKKLSSHTREELYGIILRDAIEVSIAQCSPAEIDQLNILQATYYAMRQSVQNLKMKPGAALIDGTKVPFFPIHQVPIVRGDQLSASIAAASIIAKVTRDRLMQEADSLYPEYGFAEHKGYPTEHHVAMLHKYGPCLIHRKTFTPVNQLSGLAGA